MVILEEMENWSKVATSDGFLGYVENKRLENLRSETLIPVTDYQEPEYTSIRRDHKISLGGTRLQAKRPIPRCQRYWTA